MIRDAACAACGAVLGMLIYPKIAARAVIPGHPLNDVARVWTAAYRWRIAQGATGGR